MSHTEGKLEYSEERPNCIISGQRIMGSAAFEADARRLVACWNEHDGLVHDNARLYESLNSEMRARIEAEKERDELVVALRKFNHDVLEEFAYAPNPGEVEAILAKYPEAS